MSDFDTFIIHRLSNTFIVLWAILPTICADWKEVPRRNRRYVEDKTTQATVWVRAKNTHV